MPAVRFEQDIATITSYASPLDFSEKVNLLLNDDKLRHGYPRKALSRAQMFTWEEAAQRILSLFKDLNRKKKLVCQNRLLPFFSPYWDAYRERIGQKSVLLNLNTQYEEPMNSFGTFNQPVEDGLVLSLLKTHTVREVETVLRELIEDEETAKSILAKCHGFIQATA